MKKIFRLEAHGSTVKTEAIAGLSTFLAMLYIVPVNAAILSAAGMPFDALVTVTALMTLIASVTGGLWANTPIAMSVGMGLNAYFSFGLVKGMGIPWQSALGVVFLSGVLYVLISITPLRRRLITAIPTDLKRAVSAGIGAFIAFIGLTQSGIIVDSPATLVTLGDMTAPGTLLAITALLIALFLTLRTIRGAFILAIFITTALAWLTGITPLPDALLALPASPAPLLFALDIPSALGLGLLPVVLTFLITDIFDTVGTLTGVGLRAGLFNEEAALQKTIEADAAATALSGIMGVSSTTAFIESAAGVEAGGRTGLTAVVAGMLFVLPLFFLPLFQTIPGEAIYPVLIVIGMMMFSGIRHIDFKDKAVAFSSFFFVLGMPLTYSITNGLLLGSVVYALTNLMLGKQVQGAMLLLASVALLLFFVL